MNMRQWRLIYDYPASGAENMAVDEAILAAVGEQQALPTLRLYRWEPFCLSMGYGQRFSEVDVNRLEHLGWDLVRRPTGGKAILHGDELTYSVALPGDDELAQGDVVESYRRISQALMIALRLIGLEPQSEVQEKGTQGQGPVCFEVPSHYEITAGGKKLIGSAQVRRRNGILQHGTLPLYGDITRICECLHYEDELQREQARQKVRERATTLEAALGQRREYDEVAQAMIEGFARAFDVEFNQSELTAFENQQAEQFLYQVYATPEWTAKR
jgi:lipoyl(octanoyl) transferase